MVKHLTYAKFACLTARLAERACNWSAEAALSIEWEQDDDKVDRQMMNRFQDVMRKFLDHIDSQVPQGDG